MGIEGIKEQRKIEMIRLDENVKYKLNMDNTMYSAVDIVLYGTVWYTVWDTVWDNMNGVLNDQIG